MIRDRLIGCGATDGFVTDFGPILSLFFTDPDGLEGEVCVENPDRRPGVVQPTRHPVGPVPDALTCTFRVATFPPTDRSVG